MKKTLTTRQVSLLLEEYPEITEIVTDVTENTQAILKAVCKRGTEPTTDELNQLKRNKETVQAELNTYTEGFYTFLRSAAKLAEDKKPPQEMRDRVRDTLSDAREQRDGYYWIMERYVPRLRNLGLIDSTTAEVLLNHTTDDTPVAAPATSGAVQEPQKPSAGDSVAADHSTDAGSISDNLPG